MVHMRAHAPSLRHDSSARVTGEPLTGAIPATEPIDRAHLGRYTLGSLMLEREILGLFLAQLPLGIEQLRFASTDREWQIAAHTIKGSARAVGAWRIASLALEAEQTSGVTDEAVREHVLAMLENACEEVESFVETALPDTAACT